MSDESVVPDHLDLPDVTAESLSRLINDDDPELSARILELTTMLRTSREVRLAGWNSFLDSATPSD
ncbi:hypothetical protein ACQPZK_20355 [Micromonospora sp. CA-249363]|jgi:hypothetical protein|uniref:hypothetical protein n=1 Tax=Micromonospora sp. CA-249363 TaxID=3239963 RepID=UPI003D8E541F